MGTQRCFSLGRTFIRTRRYEKTKEERNCILAEHASPRVLSAVPKLELVWLLGEKEKQSARLSAIDVIARFRETDVLFGNEAAQKILSALMRRGTLVSSIFHTSTYHSKNICDAKRSVDKIYRFFETILSSVDFFADI